MGTVHLKVVVDAAHLARTEDVCAAVRAAGMRVETVVAEAGTIFGSADATMVTVIARVEGVLHAAPEAGFEVPPLTDDVPQ